jgi:hypothetical protein
VRAALEPARLESLFEAWSAPPFDVAGELAPGRRDRKLVTRGIQPRQLLGVTNRHIAERLPALHVRVQLGVREPDEPQLGEAPVRPGALLETGVLQIQFGAELGRLPASRVPRFAEDRGQRFDLHRDPMQGRDALHGAHVVDHHAVRRELVVEPRPFEQIVGILVPLRAPSR